MVDVQLLPPFADVFSYGFFPDMVYDQLYMEYKMPEGTSSEKIMADLAEIEEYLHTRPEIKKVVTSIGGASSQSVTAEQFSKMGYQERVKLFTENPELYKELTK